MANCYSISSGVSLGCFDSVPGIKNIYLQSIDLISGFTLSSNTITSITMSGSSKLYRFQSPKFTSTFEQTPNLNEENGVFGITPQIKFRLLKNSTTLRDYFLAIGTSKMIAIVQGQDDRYWLVGCTNSTAPYNDNGLMAINGTKLTYGTKKDDFNGAEFVLEGFQSVPCYEIASSVIAGITSN